MKILVVTPYLPHRAVGHGGGTAVRDLVTWLARGHEVLVAALVRPGESERISEVTELGVEVAAIPFRDKGTRGPAAAGFLGTRLMAWGRSLASGYPWYVEKYWSRDVSRRLGRIVEDFGPDAVQLEYLQLALLVRDLRRTRDRAAGAAPLLVLNSHELGSLPRQRRASRAGNPWTAWTARREAEAWRRLQVVASGWADRTLCVTPEDHDLYAAMGGRNLVTVPLGMDLSRIEVDWTPGAGARFLFLGSFDHRPNRLAAAFLLDEVWPKMEAALTDCRLTLAGPGSREWLAGRGGPGRWERRGVAAAGFVDDLTALFRAHHRFLAPLPEGGGIKIKILEAMARGIPVVTSPIGAEGITSAADDAVVIAPCDHRFTAAVLATMDQPDEAARRAERARALVEESFSWEAIIGKLTDIYRGK